MFQRKNVEKVCLKEETSQKNPMLQGDSIDDLHEEQQHNGRHIAKIIETTSILEVIVF